MNSHFIVWVSLLFLEILICHSFPNNHRNLKHDPDMARNVSELISSKGYPVENHIVQTEDGYLLSVQRIPHGKNQVENNGTRPVVFLQHGILSASSDWVLNFPEQSLGFILADIGYDVWLGNARGNTYSKHHIKLKPSMPEFWNYSFDQMAEYDLPAMIDYVLNKTEEKQLIYVGHSQGTTVAFALLSQSPLYNEKIKLFVALAPVTTVGYMTTFVKYLAPFAYDIEFLLEILGVYDFLPSNPFLKFISEKVCDSKEKFICEDIMFLIFGWDKKQLNETRLAVYAAHTPAGTSCKSLVHFAQLVNSKIFRKYDYGKDNMKHYNQTTPPEYDVSNITTPTALFWSKNDDIADTTDVSLLHKKLKSLVESYCVQDPAFNHADFVWAMDAKKLLYDEVLSLLRKYSSVS